MSDTPLLPKSARPVLRQRRAGFAGGLVARVRAAAGEARTGRGTPVSAVIKQAVPIWLVSRALYLVLTYLAVLLTAGRSQPKVSFAPERLLMLWQRWDVNWYLSIAARGYSAGRPPQAAFFPLYPALTAGVNAAIGGSSNLLPAAMIVTSLGTLIACIGVGLLAVHEFGGSHTEGASERGNPIAAAAMRVMLAYPLALFLFAGYADSLLVALCAFSLYFARTGGWRWAALCAFAAGLTRPTAIILVLPLFYEYGRQREIWHLLFQRAQGVELAGRLRPRIVGTWLLVSTAAPIAIGLYALYQWRLNGDPLLFAHLQASFWYRTFVPPWQLPALAANAWSRATAWGYAEARMLVDEVPLVVSIVLTGFMVRRMPLMYSLYMLGVLFTSVLTPVVVNPIPLEAVGRYLLPSVPIYLLLGLWVSRRPWLDQLIIGGGMALQAVLVVFFLTGGPLI
ncbi:MAG: hypothetical protein C5B60_01605 [Chloroflexi bacterium]|nr:MAG: hypothetical protein C5B60_01605 [Chloroflexota bacterium]